MISSFLTLARPCPLLLRAMGNACIPPAERSAAERWAAQKAAMRQTGIEAPSAVLMLGGVIRLTANADCLFDFSPLPQHDEWLQGRLSREEWSALVLSINDAAIDCDGFFDRMNQRRVSGLIAQVRPSYCAIAAARMRARWLERGIDLVPDIGPPVTLYFKIVPVGSSPVNNPAGLGDMSGTGAGTGTVASPPAYPADNAPPGGPPAAAPAVASVYAFPIVVKPAPSHSSASASGSPTEEGQSSASFHLTVSVFRFCPICGATVESHSARKPFCAECGGKWR